MTITSKAALVLAIGLCASACGGSGSSPTTPTATTSLVTYSAVTAEVNPSVLPTGDSAIASVRGWTTKDHTPIFGPIPVKAWSSSNTSVATISSTGSVTAIAPGTATLTGASDAGPYAATLNVFGERDIEALDVTCISPVRVTQITSCEMQLRTRVGNASVRATWSSSNAEIASVLNGSFSAGAAFVMGRAPGQALIRATYGAFTATATIEVRN